MTNTPSDKRYKIVYHKDECIGAFACVAAEPSTWEQDGAKADLVGFDEQTDETYIKYVDELNNNLEAAQSCPVNCIHIVDQEEDKKLI
jgi:ferredoxin